MDAIKKVIILFLFGLLFQHYSWAQCDDCDTPLPNGGGINVPAGQTVCLTGEGETYSLNFQGADATVIICADDITISDIGTNGTGNSIETYASGTVIDEGTLNHGIRFYAADETDMLIDFQINPGNFMFFEVGEFAEMTVQGLTTNSGGEVFVGRNGVFRSQNDFYLQGGGEIYNTGTIIAESDMRVQGGDNILNILCGESIIEVAGNLTLNEAGGTLNGILDVGTLTVNGTAGPVFPKEGAVIKVGSINSMDAPTLFLGDSILPGECATFELGTAGSWNGQLTNTDQLYYCGPEISSNDLGDATESCDCQSQPEFCDPRCFAPENVTISGDEQTCEDDPVVLTASADNMSDGVDDEYRYRWYIGSVDPANLVAEYIDEDTLTVSESGDYIVVITNLIDEEDCQAQNDEAFEFTVSPIPETPVISGDDEVCEGQSSVTYTVDGADAGSEFTWTVPSGASIVSGQDTPELTVNFNNASPGEAVITVEEETEAGCETVEPAEFEVTIRPLPETSSIDGPIELCAQDQGVEYTVVPDNPESSYQWIPSSGVTLADGQGTATATFNFGSSATTRSISVIEENEFGCEAEDAFSISVSVNSLPSVPTISGPEVVCEETSHNYTVSNSHDYTWTVDGASAASLSGQEITVDFSTSDATLSVLATNSDGCASESEGTLDVSVNERPETPEITSEFDTICEGTTNATFAVENTQ